MTTYTHDNGIIVTHFKDGRLYFDEDGRSNFFAADEAAAIHAAYLHSLGLELFEHDGDRWLIPLEGDDDGCRYIMRLSDHGALWASPVLPPTDRFDRALIAYLAAQTPPESPQPGERWLLGMDLGSVEQPVEVIEVGGELYFAWQDGGTMPRLERVADRHPSTYRRAES